MTTIKQIPTVAKVEDMITQNINNKTSQIQTNCEYNFVYIIDNLGPINEFLVWTSYTPVTYSKDNTQWPPTYWIDAVDKFALTLHQDNTNSPTAEIRLGDDVIYTLDYTFSYPLEIWNNYYFGSKQAYIGRAEFNLQSIGELNTNNKEGDLKLWIEQNGIFREVLTFPTRKKITAITKPNENFGFTFATFRESIYPIGGIYISTNNIDPGTFIGGTWETITSPITGSYAWKRTA